MKSEEGRHEFAQGLQILSGSRQIEDLIQKLHQDRHHIREIIPYLPDELQEEILGEKFTLSCLDRFRELDKDNSGTLEPAELFPIIMEMTKAHHLALDMDQCERFTAIFDDAQTGFISQKEFVNFARFLMVMCFLQTEEGTLSSWQQLPTIPEEAPLQMALQGSAPVSPQSVGHLSVDVDFYQQKSEKLAKENADQRARLLQMEERMRAMEDRMEMQENKLRHAAIDMNSPKSK